MNRRRPRPPSPLEKEGGLWKARKARRPRSRPGPALRRAGFLFPGATGASATGLAPWTFHYIERTRQPAVNVVFVMPMLLVYLVCRFTLGEAIENQAAESLRDLLRLLGRRTAYFLMLTTAVALGSFAIRRLLKKSADVRVFPAMVFEGVLYGLLLGGAAQALSAALPVGRWFGVGLFHPLTVPGGARGIGIAVGAGIFEELLFRGLVCFGLFRVVRHVLGADRWSAGAVAVVVSAFLFSAYHHWGAGGEAWDAARFTFRFHAGVLLGVVFLTRGLGIAALAHGFYDALVLLG